uniref:PHD-type domain-containing protein n=1 Tax=Clytia hemisphaerica TaxID=252671 RepID=A0A7M6DL30_9CNID
CSKDQTEVASIQSANQSETAKTSQKVRTTTRKRPKSQTKPHQIKPIVIPELPPIINLPGKKEAVPQANLPLAKDSTCQNPNCSVVFGSKADKKLDTQRSVNNMAIGCDAMDCERWVHVCCAGKRVTDVGELKHIELFCPLHNINNNKTRAKRTKRK